LDIQGSFYEHQVQQYKIMSIMRISSKSAPISLLLGIAMFLLVLTSCTGEVNGVPEERLISDASISHGRTLIANYGCGSCHTIPGVPGADSMAGPPLEYFYQRMYIAGKLPNTLNNLIQWLQDPQSVVPGNAMPNLNITEDEARDIAAYLYHKITINDLISQ
jgi:cytochrome c